MPADLINYGTKASDRVGCDKQNLVCASYELRSEETFTVCKIVQGVAGSCLLEVRDGRHLVKL